MQRYYGICLDDMGSKFNAFHIAACLVNLPAGAKTLARINPALTWDVTTAKLHSMHQSICGVEIPRPWEEQPITSTGLPALEAVTMDEWERWRNSTFKEVEDWQETL